MSLIAKDIIKEFGQPAQRVLHGISLEIQDGEFVSISGRSGSGKSTLLYILSSLDYPTSGTVSLNGMDPQKASSEEVHLFRCQHIGFIFQFHYLLPELTALENVLLPAKNLGCEQEKMVVAEDYLRQLEIIDQMQKYPSQMSGGQQQRVAIARSLIMNPRFIFADEPTGNLDSYNAKKVMEILMNVNKEKKTTVVLVTHEPDFSAMAEREIFLVDGKQADKRDFLTL
jgi:ABC-type lipoprotein export system ATPase subunit